MSRMVKRAVLLYLCPMFLWIGLLLGQQVEVESFSLKNGMEFLLVPRKDQPNAISAGWVAKVGSVNERPGITGISHFFEHMMFKGTRTIGTRDPEKDGEFISEQEVVRNELRHLHLTVQYRRWKQGEIDDPWDPVNDTERMQELRETLKTLMDSQREITVKNEFDQVYTSEGASQLNAFTSHDLTFYVITVPSNKFELWCWMESDRLLDSVFREFYEERDVVHEERRMRTESTPTGVFQEQFEAMFWQSSPYSWPVVGWTYDLNSYTRQQAEDYYKTYYAPNNLVGVVVGDFDPREVKATIKRYFARLPKGSDPPPLVTLEMKQTVEKRMFAEGGMQPQVQVRYHSVPFGHADEAPLEVMSEILNGRTGRLYRAMVEGDEIAATASVNQDTRKYGGAFTFSAECKGEATPEQLEKVWYKVLKKLQKEPVTAKELQKVKNRSLADSYRRLESNFFLMIQLGFYEALGGWEYINDYPGKIQSVTAADIQRVAEGYFDSKNRSVAIYTRDEKIVVEPEDPELAALDPQGKQMVKQFMTRIDQIQDPEQLRAMLPKMEEQREKFPPQARPAMDYILKKVRLRLDKLESNNSEGDD